MAAGTTRFTGLHHAMPVSDLGRSVAFYCKLLDMDVTYRIGEDCVGYKLFPGTYLNLVQVAPSEGAVPTGVPGDALTIVVENLDATYRRLQSSDLETLSPPVDHGYARKFRVRDPDGNVISIAD